MAEQWQPPQNHRGNNLAAAAAAAAPQGMSSTPGQAGPGSGAATGQRTPFADLVGLF